MAGKWLLRPSDAKRWFYSASVPDQDPAQHWIHDSNISSVEGPKVLGGVLIPSQATYPFYLAAYVEGAPGGTWFSNVFQNLSLTRLCSPNQWSRVKLHTVSTNGFANGAGPAVRVGQTSLGYDTSYCLNVSTTWVTLFAKFNNRGINYANWTAADGDIWELQVRSFGQINQLTVLRNYTVMGVFLDAAGSVPGFGLPGVVENGAGTYALKGGGIEWWEGGELPEMVPWFVPSATTPYVQPQRTIRNEGLDRRLIKPTVTPYFPSTVRYVPAPRARRRQPLGREFLKQPIVPYFPTTVRYVPSPLAFRRMGLSRRHQLLSQLLDVAAATPVVPQVATTLIRAIRRISTARQLQLLTQLLHVAAAPSAPVDETQSGVSRLIRSRDDELWLLAVIKKFLEVNG